eukprot:593034-Prymnesium_polylepis.1
MQKYARSRRATDPAGDGPVPRPPPPTGTHAHERARELQSHDCSSADCGWTAAWAYSGSAMPGTSGWAGNDGSTGYYCCC